MFYDILQSQNLTNFLKNQLKENNFWGVCVIIFSLSFINYQNTSPVKHRINTCPTFYPVILLAIIVCAMCTKKSVEQSHRPV